VMAPNGLRLNTWSHVAGTYEGSTLRLYVNGTLVTSEPKSGSISAGNGPLQIGGNTIWDEFMRVCSQVFVNRSTNNLRLQIESASGQRVPLLGCRSNLASCLFCHNAFNACNPL